LLRERALSSRAFPCNMPSLPPEPLEEEEEDSLPRNLSEATVW
jgi:hypothetical protein